MNDYRTSVMPETLVVLGVTVDDFEYDDDGVFSGVAINSDTDNVGD